MSTMTIHVRKPVGGFEEVYPRAPFSELIRLTLIAAEALRRRTEERERPQAETARPAAAA